MKKIALVNGSRNGTKIWPEGMMYLDVVGHFRALGIRGLGITLTNWFSPAYNTSAKVFKGYLRTGLFSSVAEEVNIFNQNPKGCMDVVPGGLFNTQKEIQDGLNKGFDEGKGVKHIVPNWNTIKYNHSFIPTISALGFKNSNFDWSQPVNNRNLVQTGEIYFDDYFAPAVNQEHVSLSSENVAWLNTWLENVKNDTVTCAAIQVTMSLKETDCNQIEISISGSNPGASHTISSRDNNVLFDGVTSVVTTSNIVYGVVVNIPGDFYIKASTFDACGRPVNVERGYYFSHPRTITGVFPEYVTGDHVAAHVTTTSYDTYYRWYINDQLLSEGEDRSYFCTCEIDKEYNKLPTNILRVQVETSCGVTSTAEHEYVIIPYGYFAISLDSKTSYLSITTDENKNSKINNNKAWEFDQVIISDMKGNVKYKKRFNNVSSYQMDVSELTNGIYTLQLLSNDKILENKVFQIKR